MALGVAQEYDPFDPETEIVVDVWVAVTVNTSRECADAGACSSHSSAYLNGAFSLIVLLRASN
jgi:hypothetical protein